MDFDPRLHQKVSYVGHNKQLKKSLLYVVIKEEFPDLYQMKLGDEVVIHILDKFNQIIKNSDSDVRELFKARLDELKLEGDLYNPDYT